LYTSPALVLSLIGPGSVAGGAARPDLTMLTIAVEILSRNAAISASLLPETATSFAMAISATESLLFSACACSSFIVAYGYFGWPFFGGV
jgi:hypothetical protein